MTAAESVDGFPSRVARVDVTVGGEPLAVYVVHPWPPGVRTHHQWSADMSALAALLDREQGAVLVAGDLNTTRDHESFRRLEALGFVDAVDQAGAGFLPTFPEGSLVPPVVAIDHVMTRDVDLVATTVVTVSISGTDHRALVVEYAAG
jgi:endonuclease/exonuclease/phosphatase (EEP) superfamily protein YafD